MAVIESWRKLTEEGSVALMRRLFSEVGRDFMPRYAYVIVINLIVASATAASVWLIRDVVNEVFFEKREAMLYLLVIAMAILGVIRGVGRFLATVAMGRIGNAIVARMQNRLYNHLINLGIDFYDRTPSGELVTRMGHNSTAARDVLHILFTAAGRDLLTLIGLVVVMVAQNPLLSLVVIVLGPIAVIGIAHLVRRVRGVALAQFNSFARLTSDMQETARGIRVIKAFNMEPTMRQRMADAIEDVRLRSDKIVHIGARASPLMEILGAVSLTVVTFIAGYQVIYMDVDPGALISFVAAVGLAYEPAKRLARVQIELEAGLVGVRLMYELLDVEPTIEVPEQPQPLRLADGTVRFDKVDFAYDATGPLFRNFDFTAEGGKVTALVGPSGSGKSTLISLIERFYGIGGGRITIDGQDISTLDTSSLRDHVTLVSQDIVLFRDTIRENIRFGRPGASDAEVEAAARAALAHDFILRTEDGYDTHLLDSASTLSGGQRQRLAIARAILRDASIILLDEATASLDTESEHKVQTAFDHLMQGRTTIVIAHRLSTVKNADKICVLVDGEIVEEGSHDALLAADGAYARLYRLQFRTDDAPTTDVREPAE